MEVVFTLSFRKENELLPSLTHLHIIYQRHDSVIVMEVRSSLFFQLSYVTVIDILHS